MNLLFPARARSVDPGCLRTGRSKSSWLSMPVRRLAGAASGCEVAAAAGPGVWRLAGDNRPGREIKGNYKQPSPESRAATLAARNAVRRRIR